MPKPVADGSSDFRIFETDEFQGLSNRLPVSDADFIDRKLHDYAYPQLRKEPCFGINIKKLKGNSPETWRYRIGGFRVFYLVDTASKIVSIISIDNRRNAYR